MESLPYTEDWCDLTQGPKGCVWDAYLQCTTAGCQSWIWLRNTRYRGFRRCRHCGKLWISVYFQTGISRWRWETSTVQSNTGSLQALLTTYYADSHEPVRGDTGGTLNFWGSEWLPLMLNSILPIYSLVIAENLLMPICCSFLSSTSLPWLHCQAQVAQPIQQFTGTTHR